MIGSFVVRTSRILGAEHRSTLTADACYWPKVRPITGLARHRTLAADARYWLPLPGERAGVRRERYREPSQVESPNAHSF